MKILTKHQMSNQNKKQQDFDFLIKHLPYTSLTRYDNMLVYSFLSSMLLKVNEEINIVIKENNLQITTEVLHLKHKSFGTIVVQ